MIVSDSYEQLELKARSQMRSGLYNDALESYQRLGDRIDSLKPTVIERRPELKGLLSLSLAQQASLNHRLGNFQQTIDLGQRLIQMQPSLAHAWRRLMAMSQIDMGQVDQGLDALMAEAVASQGNPEPWLALGLECQAQGRLEDALDNLQRAIKNANDPEFKTECYLALFDFYREQGQFDEAIEAWDEAWANSKRPDYIFPLYQMMLENGNLERAEEYVQQEKNPLRKRFYEGQIAKYKGDEDQAAKYWKQAARLDPLQYTEGHESWAEAALRTGLPPIVVVTALESVNRVDMSNHRGLLLQAVAEARLGKADAAEKILEMLTILGASSRPRQDKLSDADWEIFDELVSDEEIKLQIRHFFQAETVDAEKDGTSS